MSSAASLYLNALKATHCMHAHSERVNSEGIQGERSIPCVYSAYTFRLYAHTLCRFMPRGFTRRRAPRRYPGAAGAAQRFRTPAHLRRRRVLAYRKARRRAPAPRSAPVWQREHAGTGRCRIMPPAVNKTRSGKKELPDLLAWQYPFSGII